MRAAIAPMLAALLLAAGCGESAEDQAMADICSARDDISAQVDELAGLTVTTATTEKVRDGLQTIRDDLSTIADATRDLSDDRRQDVQAANDEFARVVRETLHEVGTTVSVEDASAQIKSAAQQLKSRYRSTFGELDCS